jgi:REP element-mobilizing transposase RayT
MKRFDGERYQLAAYVVMDDHVHALATPIGRNALKDILHSWKSFTAHQVRRERKQLGPVWQNEYFDRMVRDDKELVEKLDYIARNPSKRWPDIREYPWVWTLER